MKSENDLLPLEQAGQYLGMNIREVGSSDDGMVVEGIANDTSVTDSYGTRFRFLPEAFEARAANPVVLFNHDTDNPIGRDKDLGMRGSQLRIQAVIHPDARTPGGLNIPDLVRRKILRGWSIRFETHGAPERFKSYELLTVRRLPEISIVTLPSNELSLMTMRSRAVQGGQEAKQTNFWNLNSETRAKPVSDQRSTRAGHPLPFDMLCARLAEALEEIDSSYYTWIKAVFDSFVIVSHDMGVYYTQHVYTVDLSGNVTLEPKGTEVLPTWNTVSQPIQTELSLPNLVRAELQPRVSLEQLRSDLRKTFFS